MKTKTTQKGTKARKTISSAEVPRHRQAAEKLARFGRRQTRLIAKWGRFGQPVIDALTAAQRSFKSAVAFLNGLPDDFSPAALKNGESEKKSAPAEKGKKSAAEAAGVKAALGVHIADAEKVKKAASRKAASKKAPAVQE